MQEITSKPASFRNFNYSDQFLGTNKIIPIPSIQINPPIKTYQSKANHINSQTPSRL